MLAIILLTVVLNNYLCVTAVQPPDCKNLITAYPPDPSTRCCGLENFSTNKIVGGEKTGLDQYPWLALVEYLIENTVFTCGGSLISSKYVLTASHCVQYDLTPEGKGKYTVVLGEYNTTSEGQDCIVVEADGLDCTDGATRIPVEQIIRYSDDEGFKAYRHNDIALIRLKEAAPFTDFIRPICLPNTDITHSTRPYLSLIVAGWGAVGETSKVPSTVKMDLAVPYVNTTQCHGQYLTRSTEIKFVESQICAGGQKGKDTCSGDSGGPLMYEHSNLYEVIGVLSFGQRPCGLGQLPSIYTKVLDYKEWIMKNIKP